MSETKIKARIAAREAAKEVRELLSWEDGTGADYAESFLSAMRELLPQKKADIPREEKPVPIAMLGAHVIPFGLYARQPFDAVPLEYLDWLCREQEGFYRVLKAYLTHPELESRRQS